MARAVGQPVSPAPISTPMFTSDGAMSPVWVQWFTTIWSAVSGPANIAAPAAINSPGYAGQLAFDQDYLYVYVGAQWKRTPLTGF